METKLLQFIVLCLIVVSCKSCEIPEGDTLPPETQTGANTFGCYVNGELFTAQWGYNNSQFGMPHLYAEYGTQINMLEIVAYGKKGSIKLQVLNPKEKMINTSFTVYATIDEWSYEGVNWFLVRDTITKDCSFVEGKQDIGEIYITKLDVINEIVSGTFYCKMGQYDNDRPKDIDTYLLDSIASISQGRFDIIMYVNHNW